MFMVLTRPTQHTRFIMLLYAILQDIITVTSKILLVFSCVFWRESHSFCFFSKKGFPRNYWQNDFVFFVQAIIHKSYYTNSLLIINDSTNDKQKWFYKCLLIINKMKLFPKVFCNFFSYCYPKYCYQEY